MPQRYDTDEIDEENASAHPAELDSRTLYVYQNGSFWPLLRKRQGRPPRYPVETLRPNESIFFEGHTKPVHAIYERAKRLGIQITQRVVTENGKKGVRVWHVGRRDETRTDGTPL